MDATNQDQTQNSQGTTTGQKVTPVTSTSTAQTPIATVPAGGKETVPINVSPVSEAAMRALVDTAETDDEKSPPMVTAHPVEVERSTEVQNAGVTEGRDTQIKLSQELQDAGVTHAKAETPINVDDAAAADMPMNYAQAIQTRQTTGIRKSLKWLAAEIVFQLRRLNPELPK